MKAAPTTDEPDALIGAREMLVRLAKETTFVPPRENQGLMEWADEVVDTMLPPRGGQTWLLGHRWTLYAFEAALHGQEEMCRAALVNARAVVDEHGRRACKCEQKTIPIVSSGRKICRVCFGRIE